MKKIFLLIICLTFRIILICQTQNPSKYVSEMYDFISSKSVQTNLDTKANNIYATFNDILFIVHPKGFEDQTRKGYAKLLKINTISGISETCFILPPAQFIEDDGNLSRIWIWAVAATDSLICLAVDEGVWIYHLTENNEYEHCKTIPLENIIQVEISENELHAFVEDSVSVNWYKIDLTHYEMKNVKSLVLKNPFFLQIAPVKIIAIQNKALYFLQQNEPTIEKYSLSGNLLAIYSINIPNWKKIPDEITQKINSIEDITERNYAFARYSVFENNMMHLFYVFPSERFFMIAIDRNEKEKTYITPYFIQIIGDSTIVEQYSVKMDENEKFSNDFFPFLTAKAEGNLIFAQWNEKITQFNRGDTISWQNKTQKEYKHEVNLFHRDNDPIEKIENYHFKKNYIPIDSIQFMSYDDELFPLTDVKKDKAIFIISQYPQCSSCIKMIWNYLSNKTLPNVELLNVSQDCPTYLNKKEKINEVNNFLKKEYTPLFYNTKELNTATKYLLSQKASPMIILFDKKLQHVEVIPATQIIGDLMGNISSSFINRIDNFVDN